MNPSSLTPSRPVAHWVLIGVFMLLVQVILGGITRLTGSGLSITEWDVFTGAVPPLTHHQWVAEFDKYRQSPQFRLLNPGFSLADFKFIFFWEWLHRFWARMVGVVFLGGFLYLLWKKKLDTAMIQPLLILFLLGAMQAVIGWIMVKSGLTGDAIYVQPTKLALHFVFAMGLICYAWWFGLQLFLGDREIVRQTNVSNLGRTILVLLLIQLLFGALMAGHKAAAAASTWPKINGDWVPGTLFRDKPLLLNFFENKMTVHFVHRGLGYLLFILTSLWTFKVYSAGTLVQKSRWLPLFLILLQIVLGILTVLTSPEISAGHWGIFEWLAQLHQVIGMTFMLTMLYMVFIIRPSKKTSQIGNGF